jgi:hypothetical protein
MNIEVICINDQYRPNEVPLSRWIKKGNHYHIIEITKLNAQNGIYGCKLAEINNDDLVPYQFFRLDRFAVVMNKDVEEALLEQIDISDLDEVLKPEETVV